jgi:hypothetical protein
MNFLHSYYSTLMGFAILDERTRYEIDFPLVSVESGEDKKPRTLPQARVSARRMVTQ